MNTQIAKNRRDRLKSWIDERYEGVQARFVDATGINQGELSGLLLLRKSFGEKKARVLENQAGMPSGWLDQTGFSRSELIAPDSPNSNEIDIPLLANSGSMGGGSALLDEDVVIGALSVKKDWVAKYLPGISSPGKLRFIHAYGESMAPTFSGGDILLVDTGITVPDTDGVYVLEVGNELYIKRVSRRFNGQHEVTSDNPLVKTVDTLNGDHSVQVKGLVVWAWNGRKL